MIRVSKSCVGEGEAAAAADAVRRGFLGMGSDVNAFEQELTSFIGGECRQVICVNTGTSALHLALQCCGVGPGDEVVVPSLTYVASFQAISATGARPVACDVAEQDCWLDLDDVRRKITARTKAIMPVHYASNTGNLEGLYELAKKFGLRIVEDAAHAFGCMVGDQRVGAAGDIVCFSFDGIKNITAGEGGAIVTSDLAVAEAARNSRLLGVWKDTEKRYAGERSWDFEVNAQGWRYHMSNINASIGRVQLARFQSEFSPARRALAKRYETELADLEDLRTLKLDYDKIVPHIYPVLIKQRRDATREVLKNAGIETGIHYKPNHLLDFFRCTGGKLPVSEQIFYETLSLPLHPELTEQQQQLVIQTIRRGLR